MFAVWEPRRISFSDESVSKIGKPKHRASELIQVWRPRRAMPATVAIGNAVSVVSTAATVVLVDTVLVTGRVTAVLVDSTDAATVLVDSVLATDGETVTLKSHLWLSTVILPLAKIPNYNTAVSPSAKVYKK